MKKVVLNENEGCVFNKMLLERAGERQSFIKNKSKELEFKKHIEIALNEGKAGIWCFNLTTKRIIISSPASNILELQGEKEFSPNAFLLLIHPEDIQSAKLEWKKLTVGEIHKIKFRLVVNNKVLWVRVVSSNIWRDEDGEMQIIGSMNEITEIKEKQIELEIKKDELEFIINNIPASITQLSPDLKIIYSNYNHKKYGGTNFFNHINPDFHEEFNTKITQVNLCPNDDVTLIVKGYGKTKEPRWFRVKIIKVDSFTKEYNFTYLVISKDIHKEKEFQCRLIVATTESEERERKRIAHELHDGICQNLVALKMISSRMGKENPSLLEKNNNNAYKDLNDLIASTLVDIRRCSYDLMPIDIEQEGLFGSIKNLFILNSAASSINHILEVNAFTEPKHFVAINIYRIVQEFIQNSQKHSQCTEVHLRISENKHHLVFKLLDNGKGFPKSEDYKSGIGVLSMLGRIKNIGGSHNIITNSGEGVQLYFSINID